MTNCLPEQPRPALIQIPAIDAYDTEHTVACMFQGMQNRRVTLEAVEDLPMGQVVSVEYDDTLFLGEVLACVGSGSRWSIEVKVEQILNGLQSLMNLRARLLNEGVPQPAPATSPVVFEV